MVKEWYKANCKNSPTLKEEPLHNAIVTAINSVVENNEDFIEAFRENVIRVIGGYSTKDIPTEYDEKIESLQQEMLCLIEKNAKQGAVSEDFDDKYKSISEKINELKKAKIRFVQEKKQADIYEQRLMEMDSTLKNIRPQVRNLMKS